MFWAQQVSKVLWTYMWTTEIIVNNKIKQNQHFLYNPPCFSTKMPETI